MLLEKFREKSYSSHIIDYCVRIYKLSALYLWQAAAQQQ